MMLRLQKKSLAFSQVNRNTSFNKGILHFVDCGDPTPMNGLLSTGVTTYGSVLTVSCEDGYDLSGPSQITCQTDGSWTDIPVCVAKGKICYMKG